MSGDGELDPVRPFDGLGPDIVAELAIAALALGAGPAGALLAGLTPLVARGVQLAHRELQAQQQRSAAVWVVAGDRAGLDPVDLMGRADDDADRRHLGYSAAEAGATARYPERIIALGRALADGLLAEDHVTIDREQATIDALAAIERPHLSIMAYLDRAKSNGPYEQNAASEGAIRKQFEPSFGTSLTRVLSCLDREGLLEILRLHEEEEWDDYLLSDFGNEVLARLRAVAIPEAQGNPASGP